MNISDRLFSAMAAVDTFIASSQTEEDMSHAKNTREWLLRLRPDADEALQLAAYGHDVERALPDRIRHTAFETYEIYKATHAKRSGFMVAKIALENGFTSEDADRIAFIIENGESVSDIPDVQLLNDADSISFFDNNLNYYIADKGPEAAKQKIQFTYSRASDVAKRHIRQVLRKQPHQIRWLSTRMYNPICKIRLRSSSLQIRSRRQP